MNPYLHQIKRLSWFLLLSLALNAGLFGYIMYSIFKEVPTIGFGESYAFHSESKSLIADGELSQTLQELKGLPLDELFVKLSDKRLVEHGFTVGDLSLSALSGFYFFDLERALSRPLEKKSVAFGPKGETLLLFTNITEQDFATLETFIKREKWPFSAQGLFKLLKNSKFKEEKSLQETFFLTPEFIAVERLLSTPVKKIEKNRILDLLISADWGKFAAFYEIQRKSSDWSDFPRRLFLVDWIHQGSKPAAEILYEMDDEFALRKLDDCTTLSLLRLLEKGPKRELFAKKLLELPRSEEVKKLASAFAPKVAASAATESPVLKNSSPLIKKIETSNGETSGKVPSRVPEGIYIVQPNDSLWKIAKRLNISIELIKKLNGLTSDQLKPGRPLRVPRQLPVNLPRQDAKDHTLKV